MCAILHQIMSAEFSPQTMFTPSQLENQRLFGVGPGALMPEQPGDKGKRVLRKFAIFTGATAADLAESWGAEKLLEKIGERLVNKEKIATNDPKAINKQALFYGIGFVEDGVSDELYTMGMNTLLRCMTFLDEVSYTSTTAGFIEGWTNLGSFASGKFQDSIDQDGNVIEHMKLKVWQKPWNVVNAVNTEAFIGLLEELPIGIGAVVKKTHRAIDTALSKSEPVRFANGVAKMVATGYHIARNMMHDSRSVVVTK